MPLAQTDSDARDRPIRIPETVLGRDDEQVAIRRAIQTPGQARLHIAGPRGSGKTLLTAVVLADAPTPVCYVPCRRDDTQYQVLSRLTATLTGEIVTDGYRTAHLQRRVTAALAETPLVLVLDDVEFLLEHDGDDLLYGLSRLETADQLTIVTTATPAVDLPTAVDARTYSSYQPQNLSVAPYTEREATQILKHHARVVVPQPVTDAAVQRLARQTTNIHVGLHWLRRAAEVHDQQAVITAPTIQVLRWDAVHRYWSDTLTDFTRHHAIVLNAVEQVTAEAARPYTGMVYDRYAMLCRFQGWAPLTSRRFSDFLDHLDLLGLIQVDHFRGGTEGKTRAIRLTPLEEL